MGESGYARRRSLKNEGGELGARRPSAGPGTGQREPGQAQSRASRSRSQGVGGAGFYSPAHSPSLGPTPDSLPKPQTRMAVKSKHEIRRTRQTTVPAPTQYRKPAAGKTLSMAFNQASLPSWKKKIKWMNPGRGAGGDGEDDSNRRCVPPPDVALSLSPAHITHPCRPLVTYRRSESSASVIGWL